MFIFSLYLLLYLLDHKLFSHTCTGYSLFDNPTIFLRELQQFVYRELLPKGLIYVFTSVASRPQVSHRDLIKLRPTVDFSFRRRR